MIGKAVQGLKVVREHFKEASLGTATPSKGVIDALNELAGMEAPTCQDVVTVFDRHHVGVWNGTEIR